MAQIETNARAEFDISLTGLTNDELYELCEALTLVDRQLPDGLPVVAKWFLSEAIELRGHKHHTPRTIEIDPDIPV